MLQPGGRVCTPVQFAGHKVILIANATGGATTVVLTRNGVTIGQVNGANLTSIGFFAPWLQPDNFQVCSTNTSTTQTVAQVQMFVDNEVR